MSDKNKTTVAAVLGLLVGFGLGFLYGKPAESPVIGNGGTDQIEVGTEGVDDTGDSNTVVEETPKVTETTSVKPAGYDVAVSEQIAGSLVRVTSVTVENTSWITIRDNNNNEVGNILGAKRLESGVHADVTVALLRGTEAGKSYFAVIQPDDGDGIFDHEKDLPLTQDGKVVAVAFDIMTVDPN